MAWNFGPANSSGETVADVIEVSERLLGIDISVDFQPGEGNREEQFLLLDSSLAHSNLGWSNSLDFEQAVKWSLEGSILQPARSVNELLDSQIEDFLSMSFSEVPTNKKCQSSKV